MKKHVGISVIQKGSAGIICFSLILSMIPLPAIHAESLDASMSASGSQETSGSGELNVPVVSPTDSPIQPTPIIQVSPTIVPTPSDEFTPPPTSIPTPTTLPEQLDFGGEGAAVSGKIRVKTIIHSLAKQIYSSKERVSILVQNASFDEINVSLVYVNGTPIDTEIQMLKQGDNTDVRIIPPHNFIPGRYQITVTANGETSRQDYLWGVLAVNTNKSAYTQGDVAGLMFTVLDDSGGSVCDANVVLTITDPGNHESVLSTEDGTIQGNDICASKQYSLNPDYKGSYTTGDAGVYAMRLTATTPNGAFSTQDSFTVQNDTNFDVERVAATTIYPSNTYPVTLKITAQKDFMGSVTEIVPDSFTISQLDGVSRFREVVVSDQGSLDKEKVLGASTDLGFPFEGSYPMTLGFGDTLKDPLLKKIYYESGVVGHDGIDFGLPEGTPVVAVDDGQVVLEDPNGDYGSTLVIQHMWGKSYYGHLSTFVVGTNQTVTKGQKVALSGSTGLTIGAHLHFGIKLNENDKDNGYFGKIDPAPFLGLVAEAKVLGASSGSPPLRVITWDLSMKKGDVRTIGYQLTTPDPSPRLYTLGPVQFFDQDKVQVFRDTRLWSMHSSDPFTTPKWEGTVKTLKLGGQSIDFPYTDENSDENIIIKTDKKTYFDIGKTNVYFSVTNIGDQAENVKLQAQFPEDKGDVKNIWKYTENIPYQVDVPDYGLKSYTCESGWSQIVEDTSSYYVCQSQQAHQSCSRLSSDTTTCYDDSAYLGTTHKETRYKNDWQIVKASNASLTIDEHGGKGILARATLKRKFIPRNFKVRKSTQQDPYTIKPNETQYFKMEVTYPQRSSGEFYIEAVGDKDGYGLLDPYWDTGWGYRKSIAITGAGTAGTNYQKQIIVNYSSGGDVTCSSHCNADFGDVRFTASDGSTPLSYWQQSYTSSSTSTFFVKVTNNISSGNNTTIYMYYGKAGATTTSSGNDTFDFFDDFSGNLSKWTKENELGTITQAGGYVEMGGGITSGNYGHTVLGSSASYTGFQDGVVEFKHYHAANGIGEVSFRGNYAGNTGYKGRFDARSGSEQVFLMPPYSGWGNIGTAVTKWISASTWYDGKLVIHGSTLEIYDNGSLKQSMTDSTYSSAGEISLQNHYGTYTRYDDVRVRKYSATEPSFGTIGGEEVSGPSNDLLFRHGEWFSAGVKQPFTF